MRPQWLPPISVDPRLPCVACGLYTDPDAPHRHIRPEPLPQTQSGLAGSGGAGNPSPGRVPVSAEIDLRGWLPRSRREVAAL